MKIYTTCTLVFLLLTGCATQTQDPFCRGNLTCNLAMKNNTSTGAGPTNPFANKTGFQEYSWGVPTGRTYK